MPENRKTLPKFQSLDEMAAFFDETDMGDYLDGMPEVEFEINIQSRKTYFAVDAILDKKLSVVAKERGISAETLLNLWVQEKLQEANTMPVYQVAER
ncbi:MAG: BrnA antitoxin family protein [Chloroflexi bacterium]|nr:BrnA antitoxin family protein [Chloroflexota bacterium]